MAISLSLLIIIAATLFALAVAIAIAYSKFPLHLIYKSKVGYENMLDAINDPLAVVTADYTIKRANKAYNFLVNSSFQDTIGERCYQLLRGRNEPCVDCRLQQTIALHSPQTIERSEHPSGTGALWLNFSPYEIESDSTEISCAIEHIRDITILENLKNDLEHKNVSLAHAMQNLKTAQRNIREDLRLARQIQEGILPKKAPKFAGLSMVHTYHPIADVGGDIYDFIPFSNDKMAVFIGDASGHGLAAALVGTISKMSLYNNTKQEIRPSDLIAAINRDLFTNVQTNHYLTCFLGIFDRSNHTCSFSRAGHPNPVVIRRDGTVHSLNSAGTFAGVIEDIVFEESKFSYEIGDRFYLFTDGIYEVQEVGQKEYLGYDNFIKILGEHNHLPIRKIIPSLEMKFKSYPYQDDYTLLVIEITDDHPAIESVHKKSR